MILRFELKGKINIRLGQNVRFDGRPILRINSRAKLIIGNNVTINSNNNNYHLNMYSRCKLMADKQGAQIVIGDNTRIHGSCIHTYKKITIGNNCLIAANCQIFDSNGHDLSFPDVDNRINTRGLCKEVIIEDSVWLGANVFVLPSVKIGKGSIISANSVVHRNIPEMVLAGGNPIRVIKEMK